MFKKKKSKKTDTEPVTETKPAKVSKKSKKRWIFWLIILIVAAFLGANIYKNLTQRKITVKKDTSKVTAPFVIQKADSIPVNPQTLDLGALAKMPDPVKETKTQVPEATDIMPVLNDKPVIPEVSEEIPEMTDTDLAEEPAVIEPAEIKNQVEKKLNETQKSAYSLPEALTFRDHFLSEQPCADDFRKLILTEVKTPEIQEVIRLTSYFCLTTTNVLGELNKSFTGAKKQALIRYYRHQQPQWKGQVKAFFARIVKVRDLNPEGQSVPAVLDRAHNALEEKNITLCVQTLNTLPDYIKPVFNQFFKETTSYTEAAEALDSLVLSYEKE